jgi:peptidoglycan/LPS O-acetylase OafA/YrhL
MKTVQAAQKGTMQQRVRQLDSVRGLAALSVVFYHFLLVFPLIYNDTFGQSAFWLINLFKYSPLRAVAAGYQAVLLFFILSGFVLSLPFYEGKGGNYPAFMLKRICRIYLPYLGAVAAAVTLVWLCSRHGITTLSSWLNRTWKDTPSSDLIFKHVLLVDSFNSNEYDPVLWSLVQEMRLSLIFPALMFCVNRYSWKFTLGVGIGVGSIGGFLFSLYPSYTNDIFLSLECVGLFILGALLAKHRLVLVQAYHRLPRWTHYALFAGAILCYTLPWWLYGVQLLRVFGVLGDLVVALGAATLMILALASPRLSTLLLRRSLTFLGKISFSLYLYHVIILLTAINLLYGLVNLWLILLLAFALTLAVATAAYYSIEAPAMALGKYLAARILALTRGIPKKQQALAAPSNQRPFS